MGRAVDSKLRVMIIEDNQDMLSIYRGMFEGEPRFEVDMISDAMKGLRMLEGTSYDVIVLDIIMEPLTGEAFFVYLRGNERTKNLPVVVVSVLDPASLTAIEKLNHTIILQKPIEKEELFGTIDRCISLYGGP